MGITTPHLQIYYRRADDLSVDERSHAHTACDELFLVLAGSITVEVNGEQHTIGPRAFCHFPVGVFHRIVAVDGALEALLIRAPSVEDKIYE